MTLEIKVLGQVQKCGGVKSVNGILITPLDYFGNQGPGI